MTDNDKVAEFVPWNSLDAAGLAQQLLAHIKYAQQNGQTANIVAVLITEDPADPGKVYTPLYSAQSPEFALWAARVLERCILRGQGVL